MTRTIDDEVEVDDVMPAFSRQATHTPTFPIHWDNQLGTEPVEWLLKDIIPKNGLVILYAPPNAGKSFVALSWANCIASGIPWLGNAVEQGEVLYICAEGFTGIRSRQAAWKSAYDFLDEDCVGVAYTSKALRLSDESSIQRFTRDVKYAGVSPKLVIVDTFARNAIGTDENSAQAMGMAIGGLDGIRESLGCAVLVVHHSTLPDQNGYSRMRGSGALQGAADAVFSLQVDQNDHTRFTMRCEKQKDGARRLPMRLQLVPEGDSCVVTLEGQHRVRSVQQDELPW